MRLVFEQEGDFGILTIEGDVDKLDNKTLKYYLNEVIQRACPFMIVNLQRVNNISTTGLGMIFAGKNHLDDVGTLMALVGPMEELNRLLSKDTMEKMIPICESTGKAKIKLRWLALERKKREKKESRKP